MSTWPTVGVLIASFRRPVIVAQTVALLKRNLHYAGALEIVVSEDGPTLPEIPGATVVTGPGRGLGANYNALLREHPYEVVLQMDDDFWLNGVLSIDCYVQTLLEEPRAGWIRLMDIAGHDYTATLRGAYWWVDWSSPGLYIPSNRAHLKHRRFHEAFGLYPEGLKLADTENNFCQGCKDRARAAGVTWPAVLVPLDLATESLWSHVGQSWQKQGY